MNLSYFIAKRISQNTEKSFSTTVHKIAVASIAVGLAIMIVSFLILKGFQDTVINKVYSFSAHMQITKYTLDNSFEEAPLSLNTELYAGTDAFPYVDHVQEYSHKAGLVKTKDEVLGVVLKGVSKRFDQDRFQSNLIEGRFIDFETEGSYSKEVVISKNIADKLDLELEKDIIIHFFQDPPRLRKLTVVGIYETNLAEYYDDKFILGDLRIIQRLNDWPDSLAGGLEVYVKDVEQMDAAEDALNQQIPLDLYVQPVKDKYIQVFDWLFLISRQMNIFLGIILFVVCVNMISIVLILIMERTQMIGILKALGGSNSLIRRVFSLNGMRLVAKGLFYGNLLGIGVCLVQYYFKIITLNPSDYYTSYVPIGWNIEIILILNILTLLIVGLVITIPTLLIVRLNPIKSIKFD